eukprot:g4347.t1
MVCGGVSTNLINNYVLLAYTVLFSLLFIIFELEVSGPAASQLKRLFGFMFSFWGRLTFMGFIASLLWAGEDGWWVLLLLGILTFINASLNGFLVSSHPEYSRRKGTTNGKNLSDENLRSYLEKHPEVARQLSEEGKGKKSARPRERETDLGDDIIKNPFQGVETSKNNMMDTLPADNPFEENRKGKRKGREVRALYDFVGASHDPEQLHMMAGQVIHLIDRNPEGDGWARVVIDGKEGVVPKDYLSK